MIKQVIVLRTDLNMRKGKMVAQGAHASMAVLTRMMYEQRPSDDGINGHTVTRTLKYDAGSDLDKWLSGSFTKIVVGIDGERELQAIYLKAIDAGLSASLILDSGATEFRGQPTYTAVAIGPASSELIDPITGDLKLL